MKPEIQIKNLMKFLEPMISVIFWILLFASPLLFGNFEEGVNWEHIIRVWKSFVPFLFLFLLNRFVFLPYFFFSNRRWLYFISNGILILIMAGGVHYHRTRVLMPEIRERRQEVLSPPPGVPPPQRENLPRQREDPPLQRKDHPKQRMDGPRRPGPGQPPGLLPPFLSFMVVSILIIGFDTGLVLSVKWAQSEQKRIRMEKENVENQLAFLRNQVSPHFFMNTLNNIHSLIDFDTTEAKDSIIRLSRLMRHLLYDSEAEQIPLQKELEFVQNYVDLMKLRFSDKVNIQLDIPGQIPNKTIPPLLFTSFLENAFKHGIHIQGSSFVSISFKFVEENLVFEMKNSNPGFQKEKEHIGIGIENSSKRLNLLYGNRYSLEIDDGKEEFVLTLTLPL